MDEKDENKEPITYATPMQRLWAWVGVAYMVALVLLTTYGLAHGYFLQGIAPLMMIPALCGLGGSVILRHRAGQGRGGLPVCILLAGASFLLAILNLIRGLPILLAQLEVNDMRDILTAGLAELGVTAPAGAVERLCRYAELLVEQNKVMNLTAITDPEGVARLHFLDSAGILSCGDKGLDVGPGEGLSWLAGKRVIDVGTGAGFPGLVLKILEPSLSLTLLDSLGKRVTWLESVCADLGLEGVTCIHARAEEQALEPGYRDSFDVAVSRAVASLPLLSELCLPYVRQGGLFLAMKSVASDEEVQAGEKAVKRLGGQLRESVDYAIPGAGVTHRLVRVTKFAGTPKGFPRKWAKIKKEPL